MNNDELQQLKMAWLAAEEAGDKDRQLALLRDYPDAQEPLIDFIAAYHITEPGEENAQQVEILPLTRRAFATTLERIFSPSMAQGGLRQLRVIELVSLSERQLVRLADFFHVGVEQFGNMLNNSQPIPTLDRRQTAQAARNTLNKQKKQSFAEAVKKSTMSKEEKKEWLV